MITQRTEQDWDALAEKQLASITRDMKATAEDAMVRAVRVREQGEEHMTQDKHEWRCRCVDCLEVKLKQADEEIVMLHKVCASKKQRWVDLNEDEVLRLWQICKIPVHLEKPNDIGHRFAQALSFGLREVNYYAFCINAREEKNT